MAVTTTIQNGKMVITADLDGNSTSKSGKSTIAATTSGFVQVGDYKMSLNIIKIKKQ